MSSRSNSESEEPENKHKISKSKKLNKSRRGSNGDASSSSSDESRRSSMPQIEAPKRQSSTSPKKKVALSPLKRFISEHEDLTKLDVNTLIGDGDDICLLEVPKTIDPSNFMEKLINFDRRTKVKINKVKYIIEPEVENVKPINLLTNKLQIFHPISLLKLREYNKQKHKSEVIESASSPPSLPDNLKVRHPLFGSDYEEKILLNDEIQRKLESAIHKASKKMKKKKHKELYQNQDLADIDDLGKTKKHRKNKVKLEPSTNIEENNDRVDLGESIFGLLESHLSSKNKSRTNSQSEASFTKLNNTDTEKEKHSSEKKKNKNIKQEVLSQTDEESSTGSHKVRNKKIKRNNSVKEVEANISAELEFSSELDKSKRIKKNNVNDTSLSKLNVSTWSVSDHIEKGEDVIIPSKKRNLSVTEEKHDSPKKKTRNIKQEILSQAEEESAQESEKEQKKKKKRRNSVKEIQPDISEQLGYKSEKDDSKRKKKKSSQSEASFSEFSTSLSLTLNNFEIDEAAKKQKISLLEDKHNSPKKKHKNIKQKILSPEEDESAQESEKEQNKKKKRRNSVKGIQSSISEEFMYKSDKDDSKRKRKNSQSEASFSNFTNSISPTLINSTADKGTSNTPKEPKMSFSGDDSPKKKHKSVKQEILSQAEEESSPESEKGKIKKKKRRNSVYESQPVSEKLEYNADMESPKRNKHKSKSHSLKLETNAESDVVDGIQEKRKRKSSTKGDLSQFDDLDDFEDSKIENQTKKNNLVNSTVIPGLQLPIFEFDVSGIGNTEQTTYNEELIPKVKKEKKKIKQEILSAAESSDELSSKKQKRLHEADDEAACNTSPKKKLKKAKEEKKDDVTNSLIMDLLKKVKSEMDTGVTPKKKKKSDG